MRKPISYAIYIAFVCLAGLSSCSKDGQYNPEKKISKIYTESLYNQTVSTPKSLSERWTWDQDKVVSIDHYYDNNISYTDLLSYDGDRLSEYKTGNYYVSKFIYNKSKLKSIETYDGSILLQKITIVERDGKKIKKLSYLVQTSALNRMTEKCGLLACHNTSVLRFITGENNTEHFRQNIDKTLQETSLSKGTASEYLSYTIEFKYDKNNIVEKTWRDSERSYSIITKYTHDDGYNPFYRFYHANDGFDFSKNNVASETVIEGTLKFTLSYRYEYDGKWPLKQTQTYTSDNVAQASVIYFEYN